MPKRSQSSITCFILLPFYFVCSYLSKCLVMSRKRTWAVQFRIFISFMVASLDRYRKNFTSEIRLSRVLVFIEKSLQMRSVIWRAPLVFSGFWLCSTSIKVLSDEQYQWSHSEFHFQFVLIWTFCFSFTFTFGFTFAFAFAFTFTLERGDACQWSNLLVAQPEYQRPGTLK